ncbi:acrylate utilization transcriptional regulator AcuR [Shewanella sp. HL-SH8]|uniref:acrylate utilization transcriptional regulator AcuR n=1 Tax=Shewanella sp. HL-SH8 TaxID=3436242 RepID=UPI003EBBFFEB
MNIETVKPRRGRPPKANRDNQDTKAALIRSGLEQLTETGFAGSGIDLILKRVGVPKGSFYHYFSSKEVFGQIVIENYAGYFMYQLDKCLSDESLPALHRLSLFVDKAKLGMEKYHFKRGCLIGNLGQEVDLLPESYRQQLITVFASWQQRLSLCFTLAQVNNEISQSINCDKLAEIFWVGWEGAVSRAKLVQNTQPLQDYYDFFMKSFH